MKRQPCFAILQMEGLISLGLKLPEMLSRLQATPEMDFLLLGADIPFFDSLVHEPGQPLVRLAEATGANLIARVGPVPGRWVKDSTVYVFGRDGRVRVLSGWASPAALQQRTHAAEVPPPVFELDGIRLALVQSAELARPWLLEELSEVDVVCLLSTAHNGMALELAERMAVENRCYVAMACCCARHFPGFCGCSGAALIKPLVSVKSGVGAQVVDRTAPGGLARARFNVEYVRELKSLSSCPSMASGPAETSSSLQTHREA